MNTKANHILLNFIFRVILGNFLVPHSYGVGDSRIPKWTMFVREAIIIQNRSKVGNHPTGGGGVSDFTWFFPLRGWEMVFVRGGVKKHKITSHFLNLPP